MGAGYTDEAGQSPEASAPCTDGLWLMDMISGKTTLLGSLWSLLPPGATPLHNPLNTSLDSTTHTDMTDRADKTGMCFTWLTKPQVGYALERLIFLYYKSSEKLLSCVKLPSQLGAHICLRCVPSLAC